MDYYVVGVTRRTGEYASSFKVLVEAEDKADAALVALRDEQHGEEYGFDLDAFDGTFWANAETTVTITSATIVKDAGEIACLLKYMR